MARVTKKDAAAAPAAAEKKVVKRTPAAKPRKKKVVPNFVIQSSADQSTTYDAVIEKVKAAFDGEVTSVDIYVKAEEGKAYYVINGDVTGAVDLF
jgi:hypothetical protein